MRQKRTPLVASIVATAALIATSAHASQPAAKPAAPAEKKKEILFEAPPPPFSEGIFPCMECHKDQKDPTRRELGLHDVLRLASGATVPFTESYRLCGQCHGDKFRDWRAGVHGRRVGMWDGPKTYLLCVSCHNPHSPAFKGVKEIVVDGKLTVAPTLQKLKPEPRPVRPEELRESKRPAATQEAGR